MKRIVVLLALCALLASCGGKGSINSTDASTVTTLTPQAQGPPTTVKVPTAREFIAGFKQAGLPVGKVRCYTESNDPNNLLGRPGGYIEKCNWADTRYPQNGDTKDFDYTLTGGSIETFEKPGGAAQRAEYLHAFEGPGILNPGYTYQPKNANWVLRIDVELTKSQAQAYLKAFEAQL